MKLLGMGLVALLASLFGFPAASVRGATVEGTLYDGRESTVDRFRSLRPTGDEWHVPLANAEVTFHAYPNGKTYSVTTNEAGAFRIDTFSGDLSTQILVAVAEKDGTRLFSPSVPADHAHSVFVYTTSDAADTVDMDLQTAFDLLPSGDEQLLRVRVAVEFFQMTPHLYVGSRYGSVHREIFRLPVPEGAQIIENSGPIPGLQWKASSDGRWFVIDEPVPGFADQAHILRERRSWRWALTYALPAKQLHAFTFHFPTQVRRVVLFANKAGGAMSIVSTGTLHQFRPIDHDPLSGDAGVAYDVYALSEDAGAPGTELVFALEIDNVALREMSHRAIKWHGGFIVVALVGILLGLLLGSRRPKERASLLGLGPDELLDRLVALDRRFEEGRIRERDYKAYREALVEMIAAELPEEQGGVAASTNGKPKAHPAPNASASVPAAAGAILAQIRDIEAKGDGDPALAAERSRLLEALLESLEEGEGRR